MKRERYWRGRDGTNTATFKDANYYQESGRGNEQILPSSLCKERDLVDFLTLYFRPLELWENNFLLF